MREKLVREVEIVALDRQSATLEIATEIERRLSGDFFHRSRHPRIQAARWLRPRSLLARASSLQRRGCRAVFCDAAASCLTSLLSSPICGAAGWPLLACIVLTALDLSCADDALRRAAFSCARFSFAELDNLALRAGWQNFGA